MDTTYAYSIPLFCQLHGISRALYYKMVKEGKAPKTMRIGRRTLISHEAAAAWRKYMEAVPHKNL